MVSSHLRPIQYSHLLVSSSLMNIDDWMSQFIGRLLHLTHGQWIYRNISKHHDTLGSIRKMERRELLLEIDRLIHVPPEEVPEESKFLLELDFTRLRNGELTTQHYWVHAVKAAVVAGRRRTFLQRRRLWRRRAPTEQPPIPFAPSDTPEELFTSQQVKRQPSSLCLLVPACACLRRRVIQTYCCLWRSRCVEALAFKDPLDLASFCYS